MALLAITATGLLAKIAINTEETKTELRETRGKVNQLESEIRLIKAELIQTKQTVRLSVKEKECLAKNVYFEAGVEPFIGKVAVAQTTLNRVNHKLRWSDSICGVVYQKAQFSWTLYKKKKYGVPKGKLWKESIKAVEAYENGLRVSNLNSAKFYHTTYIKTPVWVDKTKELIKIGQHIFYSDDKKA